MKKKGITILLIVSMLLLNGIIAYAKEDNSFTIIITGSQFSVKGSISNGSTGDPVTILIIQEELEIEDLNSAIRNSNDIIYFNKTELQGDKTFSFQFQLSNDIENGKYKLYLFSNGIEGNYRETFDFVNPQYIIDMLQRINNAKDYDTIDSIILENSLYLRIITDDYINVNKDLVLKELFDQNYNTEDYVKGLSAFQNDFCKALLLVLIENTKDTAQVETLFKKYLAYTSFKIENAVTLNSKKLNHQFYGYLLGKDFENADAFQKEMNEGSFLVLYNNSSSKSDRKTLFNSYNNKYFNIKIPTGINTEELHKKLSENIYNTFDGFTSALNKAIKELLDESSAVIKNPPRVGGSNGGSISVSGTSTTSKNDTEFKQEEVYAFSDLTNHKWAESAINNLVAKNIITKNDVKLYDPDRNITREEFVKLLVSSLGNLDQNATCMFMDVNENEWYYPYIASAVKSEIVRGINDSEFGIGRYISREDVAVLIYRVIEMKNISLPDVNQYAVYADQNLIAEYALEAVAAITKGGIVNGYENGKFMPKNNVTRAEAAVILNNLFAL